MSTPLPHHSPPCRSLRTVLRPVLLTVWLATGVAGTLLAVSYEMTPTPTGPSAKTWPAAARCRRSGSRPTLVMFVHPRCSCTRASLGELLTLVSRCPDRMDVQVVFFQPESAGADWEGTDHWQAAGRIPGAARLVDRGGGEHRRFGARVSGEVFLYAPDGALLFHGGITAGRGHSGDNPGRDLLESLLRDGAAADRETPTFGCELERVGGSKDDMRK